MRLPGRWWRSSGFRAAASWTTWPWCWSAPFAESRAERFACARHDISLARGMRLDAPVGLSRRGMHDTLDSVRVLALNRALRVDGCFVCGRTADLFAIPQVAETVCRTCLPKLGALLSRCRDSELGEWFDVGEPRVAARASEESVASVVVADLDPRVHTDLAIAYEEMGLYGEAIREAAIVLTLGYDREDATARSLGVLFHSSRRKAGCFAGLARAVRVGRWP